MKPQVQENDNVQAKPKLNLACGRDIRLDAVNMDRVRLGGVDVAHDATRTPWPFLDGRFDVIEANHFFEHIPHEHAGHEPFFRIMEECHRVLRPGGRLVVRVPYWRDAHSVHGHPQHTRVIVPDTWGVFDSMSTEAYHSRARFRLETWRLTRRRMPRWPHIRYRNIPLFEHARVRIPWCPAWLTGRRFEAEYVLRRLPTDLKGGPPP